MSLYDRAKQTANPNLTKNELQLARLKNGKTKKSNKIIVLHKQVQQIISADKLSEYIQQNPAKARAEIINAANNCFSKPYWSQLNNQEKKDLLKNLLDYVFGFGPIEPFLDDPDITEVMVNGTKSIYYEKLGKMYKSKQHFVDDNQVRALVDKILGPLGRRIDESMPMVNARLASGHRVNAIIAPLSLDGTILTIRKFAEHVITLEEMVALNSFDYSVMKFLDWAVKYKKNIAVSGGTGSGKTTLLNALSCKISHDERIITIEDSAELRFLEHPHVIRLEARTKNSEGKGEITIKDLVINSLRMRPDRIVVGECRGSEALDMLQAMNTGHDGSLTTLHANSPEDAITRLTTMVRYAAELPVDVIENYIASAIDLLIQTARALDGSRFISQIVAFNLDKKTKKCIVTQIYKRNILKSKGEWINIPDWINNLPKHNICTNKEVEKWKSLAAA